MGRTPQGWVPSVHGAMLLNTVGKLLGFGNRKMPESWGQWMLSCRQRWEDLQRQHTQRTELDPEQAELMRQLTLPPDRLNVRED